MPLLRYLQHWLTGRGPCLQVADFVPAPPPPVGRDVAMGGPGGSRGPLVRPALPQTHHAWTSAGLDPGVIGVGIAQT
jgi:hypothetical protein